MGAWWVGLAEDEDISLMLAFWENRARPEFSRRKRLELTESWLAEMSARSFNKDGFSPTLLPAVASQSRPVRSPWLCTRPCVSSA